MINEIDNNDLTNTSKGYIQSRLNFLNGKEQELNEALIIGKEKEQEIRNKLLEMQKTIEANLSPKEKKMIRKKFKNLSIEETERVIEKEKNNPNRKKIWGNIGKVALIVVAVVVISKGIIEGGKYLAKKEHNKEIQKNINKPDNKKDSTATFPVKQIITIEDIKTHISKEKLHPGITYENVVAVVNSIQKDKVREQVIEYLKDGKIIEAQEMFGMKRNSQYTSNKATGKIDQNTLSRFADPYFGLEGKEILENADIAQDVKDIYQKFVAGEIDNNGQNYIIISKTDIYLYLFTKDHKLLHRDKKHDLIGKDIDKDEKRVPYPYYNTNQGIIYHDEPTNTDTPEGLFKIQGTSQLATNYICDGPKVALVLMPINIKTQKKEERYETNKYTLEIHPVYQPQEDPEKYEEAIDSPDIDDNTISHGCINTPEFGVNKDNITLGKSVVYITHR